MRHTASAAMEDRTLRDVERWKDKIEIRLDNRQVFFLFFGSALVACLLFILGVVVGKRLESRGRAATPEIEDPLALLDRIAATPGGADEAVTFPRTLIQNPARPERKSPRADLKPKPEPAPEKVVAVKPPDPVEKAKEPPAPPPAKPAARADVPPPAPEPAVAPKPAPVAPVVAAAAPPAPEKPPEVRPEDKPKVEERPVPKGDAKKGKFTLQLASFQDRAEAEAFMARFASEAPFIVISDLPDKGRWYRVRLGNFETNEEAMEAKQAFERAHRQIAYVAPR